MRQNWQLMLLLWALGHLFTYSGMHPSIVVARAKGLLPKRAHASTHHQKHTLTIVNVPSEDFESFQKLVLVISDGYFKDMSVSFFYCCIYHVFKCLLLFTHCDSYFLFPKH